MMLQPAPLARDPDVQRAARVYHENRGIVARCATMPIDLRALCCLPFDPIDVAALLGRSVRSVGSYALPPLARSRLPLGDQLIVWNTIDEIVRQQPDPLLIAISTTLTASLNQRCANQRVDRHTIGRLRDMLAMNRSPIPRYAESRNAEWEAGRAFWFWMIVDAVNDAARRRRVSFLDQMTFATQITDAAIERLRKMALPFGRPGHD